MQTTQLYKDNITEPVLTLIRQLCIKCLFTAVKYKLDRGDDFPEKNDDLNKIRELQLYLRPLLIDVMPKGHNYKISFDFFVDTDAKDGCAMYSMDISFSMITPPRTHTYTVNWDKQMNLIPNNSKPCIGSAAAWKTNILPALNNLFGPAEESERIEIVEVLNAYYCDGGCGADVDSEGSWCATCSEYDATGDGAENES